jgi:hypothetical protein
MVNRMEASHPNRLPHSFFQGLAWLVHSSIPTGAWKQFSPRPDGTTWRILALGSHHDMMCIVAHLFPDADITADLNCSSENNVQGQEICMLKCQDGKSFQITQLGANSEMEQISKRATEQFEIVLQLQDWRDMMRGDSVVRLAMPLLRHGGWFICLNSSALTNLAASTVTAPLSHPQNYRSDIFRVHIYNESAFIQKVPGQFAPDSWGKKTALAGPLNRDVSHWLRSIERFGGAWTNCTGDLGPTQGLPW